MYLLKKYASILVVIYMCFSISCSSKKQGKSINDLFTVTDTLEIPIDENISAIGNYYNYFDDINYAKNMLVIPSLKNELYFFDIDKKTLKKKIKLEEEGPNGVGAILKVNVIDEQYIFVNSTRSLENYLVDTNGIKIKTFSMKGNKELDSRGIIVMPRTNLIHYNQNIIVYPDINLLTDGRTGRSYYKLDDKVFASLDMKTSEYSMLPIQFPLQMRNKEGFWNTFHFTPSYDFMNDNLYYSFPGCDSLYAYDFNKKQIQRISAQSIHEVNKSNIITKQIRTIKELYSTYAANCSYFKVLTDKYNNKIYRIIGHPTEKWKDSGNINDVAVSKPCSIQVFDSKLNFLGETKIFEQNSYDFLDSFVGKKGIYISNNHPQNTKSNEENLSYTIFTLKK